jgi:transposase InsO family protein
MRGKSRKIEYYHTRRPHQSLDQDSPAGMVPASQEGTVRYRNVLAASFETTTARPPRAGFFCRLVFGYYGVRSVREECLDKVIILNERHLRRVLHEYVEYYNTRRPHQGLEQDSPTGMLPVSQQGTVRYRNVLGGIIRDYYREAA